MTPHATMLQVAPNPLRRVRLALAAGAALLLAPAVAAVHAQSPAPATTTPGVPSSGFPRMMSAMEGAVRTTNAMTMSGDVDRDFINMMIPHHEAGITMSRVEAADGTHPQLRKLAQQDVTTQEKQVAQMRSYLATLPAPSSPTAGTKAGEGMMSAMHDMNTVMQHAKPSGNQDRDFITLMIPHHDAAIDMAHAGLRYGRDPRVKQVARRIVTGQSKDVSNMKHWHKAWFGTAFPVGEQEHQ